VQETAVAAFFHYLRLEIVRERFTAAWYSWASAVSSRVKGTLSLKNVSQHRERTEITPCDHLNQADVLVGTARERCETFSRAGMPW
jgi:hypothetical protein